MKQTLRNIGKQALRATIIATATIASLLVLSRKLNTDWLEAEKMIAEQLQFSDFFFKWHSHEDIPSHINRDVHVVDISAKKKREQLVPLFDSIAAAQPYLVALDIIWSDYAMQDSIVDSLLVASIKRLPNLILAEQVDSIDTKWVVQHASFINDVQATEALIKLPNRIVRNWKAEYVIKNDGLNDTLPTFAATIARKMGVQLPKQDKEWLLDYSICETPVIDSSWHDFKLLKDKVVIIGDVKDERDAFIVPVTFRPNMKMPGVLVHKQIVQTILTDNWIRGGSKFTNWFIIYIIIWLFLFTELYISNQFTWNDSAKQATIYLTKIIILLVLIFIAYILFWKGHLYINVWGAILAPVMIWTGKLIVEAIELITQYCKKNQANHNKKERKEKMKHYVFIAFALIISMNAKATIYVYSMSGSTEVQRSDKWEKLCTGNELQETDLILTEEHGKVVLYDDKKHKFFSVQTTSPIVVKRLIDMHDKNTKSLPSEFWNGIRAALRGHKEIINELWNTRDGGTSRGPENWDYQVYKALLNRQDGTTDYKIDFRILDLYTQQPIENVVEGQHVMIEVHNKSNTPLYVNIIDRMPNGEEMAIFDVTNFDTIMDLYIPAYSEVCIANLPREFSPANTTDQLTLIAYPYPFNLAEVLKLMKQSKQVEELDSAHNPIGIYSTSVHILPR